MRIQQIRGYLPFLIFTAAWIVTATIVTHTLATNGKNHKQLMSGRSNTAVVVPQTGPRNIYKPTIRIWVHGDSIRPSIIRTEPGAVVLRAENETSSDVSLVIERVLPGETAPVARVNTTNGGKRVRGELLLQAGEYIYYDAARPEIKGSLIVELPNR